MNKSQIARRKMIEGQIYTNNVQDERVLAALEIIPREDFVPENFKGAAYADAPIELGRGRFLPDPLTFARLLKAAEIRPEDKVMDIACATGYSTAVIAQLAAEVLAIESDREFAAAADAALQKLGINNAKIHSAELLLGANKSKQFDVIFIGGRVEQLPDILISQLKDDGRLVTVLDNPEDADAPANIVIITKNGKAVAINRMEQAHAPKLTEFNRARGFVF